MNRFKGEVPLKSGDTIYTLRFSANALCELEEALGKGINQIAQELSGIESMRMKTVITVVWAGLKDRHPGITMAQVGEIITDATLVKTMEAVSDAFLATFGNMAGEDNRPTQPGQKSPGKGKNAGTGLIS